MNKNESIIDKLFREGEEQIKSGAASKFLRGIAKDKDAEAKRALAAGDNQLESILNDIEGEYAPTVEGGI